MIACKLLIVAFFAAAGATILHAEDEVFAIFLKRQAPGTPSYNCHDNCGTAITLSRQSDKCNLDAFKTSYNNCLQCAGPDNQNIWRMYGNTLSTAGSSCGLQTEPASGQQPAVGPAVHTSAGGASATPAPASGSAAASTIIVPSVISISSVAPSFISGVPAASGNATASFTSSSIPPQQSTNAGAQQRPAGVIGAIVFGMMVSL